MTYHFESRAGYLKSVCCAQEVEDDGDDADSVAASTVDHSLVRLSKFIYEQYLESSPPLPPRCGFESLFAPADPPESSRRVFVCIRGSRR